MTLLDAQEYDPEKRESAPSGSFVVAFRFLWSCWLWLWWNRYWPEERVVGHFFDALQKQDYKTAYGIWMHDPAVGEASPEQHPKYPFNEFYRDWGPGGEWGIIKPRKFTAPAVSRWRQRRGRRCDRERPRATRAGLGGEAGSHAELSAVRTHIPVNPQQGEPAGSDASRNEPRREKQVPRAIRPRHGMTKQKSRFLAR